MKNKKFEKELEKLQVELVKMQEWVKHEPESETTHQSASVT